MRKKLLLVIAIGLCVEATSAQEKHFSAGADVIGTRISTKYEVTTKSSARLDIDFTIADNSSGLLINPEYHFHKTNNAIDLGEGNIVVPYHGPGLILGISQQENEFGIEFVWGLEYDTPEVPFEIFIDAGPYVLIEPATVVSISSSFGVRYKF